MFRPRKRGQSEPPPRAAHVFSRFFAFSFSVHPAHTLALDPSAQTRWVVTRARELGFDLCGVAPAADFEELRDLPEWLARGYAGEMRYLNDPRRRSPSAAMAGARSIIVCALNYNTDLPYSTDGSRGKSGLESSAPAARSAVESPRGWISRYAWGDDYHQVLGKKLEALLAAMRAEFAGHFDARAYVDTGPVVERIAAKYAGLGWLGKNTCLLNERLGSWLFLGVIVTTLDLAPSLGPAEAPPPDLCGQCRQCLDACPTGALVEPYVLDARRCISYLTIELRGEIPAEFHDALGWHVFGCDICQDVCPYNRRAPVTDLPEFQPRRFSQENGNWKLEKGKDKLGEAPAAHDLDISPKSPNHEITQSQTPPIPQSPNSSATGSGHSSLLTPSLEWLASLTEEEFRNYFRGSAIKRTKWQGLRRNARLALENCSRETH